MYISRRGDTVGSPVWKSTILHIFSKSELSVLETMAVQGPMTYVYASTPSPASPPLHVHHPLFCLFVCLFVYLCHWRTCCLFVCLSPLPDCFHYLMGSGPVLSPTAPTV